MDKLIGSVGSQASALDQQIHHLRTKRIPCASGVEPECLTAAQYLEIAKNTPIFGQPGNYVQSSQKKNCTEPTAKVQECNSTDMVEKKHTAISGMTIEKARQILNAAPVKEYVAPTREETQEDISKIVGRQITLGVGNPEINKKTSLNLTSVAEKNSDRVSAFQCATNIFATNKLRYLDPSESTSMLYRFDGRIWTPMTLTWLRITIMTNLTTEEKTSIRGFAAFLKNVREFLLALAAVDYEEGNRFTSEDFSKIKNHAVFLNGIYDAVTGGFLPHNSELPYERLINVVYDPNDTPTPSYDQIVSFATAMDPESMKMFDYAIGYLAVPNQTGKCLFYLGYASDSGKSILSDSINNCFSDRAYKIDPEHLAGRFAYENAGRARLYCCSDMRKTELSETVVSQFKRNTGDRVIRIEAKYQTEEQVTVRFKLILVSNFPLLIKNAQRDEAFYRRVIVLPFIQSVAPENRDSTLENRLNEEMSAVFSKGVRRLREIIRQDGGIVFPESKLSRCIKDSWHTIPDMVDEFLDQTVQVVKCSRGKKQPCLSTTELYGKYKEYLAGASSFSGKKKACKYEPFKQRVEDKYEQVYVDRGHPEGYKNAVSSFFNLEYKKISDYGQHS